MTQIAALESIASKIRVNAVCPTVIETEKVTNAIKSVASTPASAGLNAMFRSTNPMLGPEVSTVIYSYLYLYYRTLFLK